MNPMIGALQRRNQKLELEKAAQKLTIDRLVSDVEMTESAGCAFVWELAQTEWKWVGTELMHCPPDIFRVIDSWNRAMFAGEEFQQARKWLRDRMRGDKEFRKTALEACRKDPNMEMETPHGRFSVRLLSAT